MLQESHLNPPCPKTRTAPARNKERSLVFLFILPYPFEETKKIEQKGQDLHWLREHYNFKIWKLNKMHFLKDKMRLWLCFSRKEAATEPSISSMTGTSSSSLLQPMEDQYPIQTSSPGTPPPFSLPSFSFPRAKSNEYIWIIKTSCFQGRNLQRQTLFQISHSLLWSLLLKLLKLCCHVLVYSLILQV